MKKELEKLLIGEVKLTNKEKNEFIWAEFGEEEDLTEEEKKYWEVRK